MTGRIRVLIVDDREVSRETLKTSLIGYDCDFLEAATGAEALALMASHMFDVSFLDLRLPDMTGIDVLTAAREHGYAIGMPVLVTGEPKPATADRANALGAKFLLKPIVRAQIRAAVQEAVPDAVATSRSIILPARPAAEADTRSAAELNVLPRLLVLDDNENWLDIMTGELGSDFRLHTTTSPEEAIASVAADPFDLVILDMKLPGTSGLDVLKRMQERSPDVRAVILTAYEDLTHATRAGRRGALDYVKKDRDTLADKIRQILRENPRETRVFFCYDRRDNEQVANYYRLLTARGFRVFMDEEDLTPGKLWELTISDAIDEAHRFVYFLSRNSFNRSGPMRGEINQALRHQEQLPHDATFFVPARLDDCGIERDIKRFQYVDLFRPNGFERLLKALTTD